MQQLARAFLFKVSASNPTAFAVTVEVGRASQPKTPLVQPNQAKELAHHRSCSSFDDKLRLRAKEKPRPEGNYGGAFDRIRALQRKVDRHSEPLDRLTAKER